MWSASNQDTSSKCHVMYHIILKNSTVLHVIQSWSRDQNAPLSFHYFENLTVLHVIQWWSSDENVPLSFKNVHKFVATCYEQIALSLFSTHCKSPFASSQRVLSNIVIGWKFSQRACFCDEWKRAISLVGTTCSKSVAVINLVTRW